MGLWVLMGVGGLAGQLAAAVLLAGQVHAQGCRPSAVFPRAGPPVQTLACEGLILYRWYGLESRVSNTPARQVHAQGDRHSAVFRGRVGDTELEKPWKGDSI